MAGQEDDSWKRQLEAAGYEVEIQLQGLGEYPGVREAYVEKVSKLIDDCNTKTPNIL
jgi:cobalamin biosynthesis Co2+ chelatase CbiK